MLARTGGFIGIDAIDTRASASGVWSLAEAVKRQEDKWGRFTKLTLDTVTDWDPTQYSLSTASNITTSYGIGRFFTTADALSHTIYIGFEARGTNPVYYKDMTIAGVRISVRNDFSEAPRKVETYSGIAWDGWSTTTAGVSAATDPTTLTYTTVATGTTAERWNIGSGGTSSTHTGMANGISSTTADFNAWTIPQLSGASYLYVESSSPMVNGDTLWLKKTITTSVGDDISIDIANFFNTSDTGTYSSVVQNCMKILVT